jgi:hypothetical protein
LKNAARIAALFICLVNVCACARSIAPPPGPSAQSQQTETYSNNAGSGYGPSSSNAAAASPSHPPAKFFEFNDIPLPPEINVQSNSSYVFQSGRTKMGFLTLRGRVDCNSLVNYFAAALPREGWRLKGEFIYGRALLIFDKPDKVSVILIKEGTYFTYVEIYVSPVSGG